MQRDCVQSRGCANSGVKASITVARYDSPAAGLPAGYSMRPIALQDADAIVAMLNREAQVYAGEMLFSASEYKVDLKDPLLELKRHTRVILDPAGEVAAIAEYHSRPPNVRPFLWVRTALEQRGRGLGSLLLEWGLSLAHAEEHTAPAGARITLGANAIAGNAAATALFATHGFAHVRDFLQMEIDMEAAPPPPAWPAGIAVRTFRPYVDDVALFHAREEAFVDHWGHLTRPFDQDFPVWQKRLHNDPLLDPSLYFLAMDEDTIAGFSLCLAPVPGELQAAWIDLLGVRRPWRKRGVGQALLLHSFGEFYRRGVTTIGLGVDAESLTGATRLYERVGMVTRHTTAVYEIELRKGVDLSAA